MAGEFLKLLGNKRDVAKATMAFEVAVAASFAQDNARMTQSEIKRRFEMCEGIFRALKGDMHWSIHRALDHLTRFLRCELDGVDWEPEAKRSTWSPGILMPNTGIIKP